MSSVRIPGRTSALRSLRWLRSRFRGGVAILCYHRVHGSGPDPFGLSISPRHFEEHLDVLSRHARPVSLAEAVRALATGNIPSRAVVVTFDDGYSDNLYTALPLLERYAVPGTVFVVSGSLGREFWWDAVARAVGRVEPALGEVSSAAAHSWRGTHNGRRRRGGDGANGRRRMAESIAAQFQALPDAERRARARTLEAQAPLSTPPEHRGLTSEELARLSKSGLVEIGAHTVSHRPLAELPAAEQRRELERSRLELEALTGRAVTSFAYPHGSLSAETTALVGSAGFRIGCCSLVELASARSDVLALPRLWPGNYDGERFERWLRRWISD